MLFDLIHRLGYQMRYFGAPLIILLCVAVSLIVPGCEGKGTTVRLTFPQGFRGGARFDAGASQRILGDKDSVDPQIVDISVPADGIIKLRGKDPYSTWSQTEAAFSDGTPLLAGGPGPPGSSPPPRNVLRLWLKVGGWLFVGTEEEFSAWGSPPTLGGIEKSN